MEHRIWPVRPPYMQLANARTTHSPYHSDPGDSSRYHRRSRPKLSHISHTLEYGYDTVCGPLKWPSGLPGIGDMCECPSDLGEDTGPSLYVGGVIAIETHVFPPSRTKKLNHRLYVKTRHDFSSSPVQNLRKHSWLTPLFALIMLSDARSTVNRAVGLSSGILRPNCIKDHVSWSIGGHQLTLQVVTQPRLYVRIGIRRMIEIAIPRKRCRPTFVP